MKVYPPKRTDNLSEIEIEEWQKVLNISKELSAKYKITSPKLTLDLSNFHLLADTYGPRILDIWKVSHQNMSFKLCLVEFKSMNQEVSRYGGKTVKGTTSVSETITSYKYFFGFLNTKRDFGRTLIRPETIMDKIADFFSPTEIDIKGYKKFSKKYYVLSNDKEKFLNSISKELLDILTLQNNFQIEFEGTTCLFFFDRSVDLVQTIDLCEIGFQLDKILNKISPQKI